MFQEMLKYLDVRGKIVTADAMHCQKETCKKIISSGGNYVFGLKGNHKNLYKSVVSFIENDENYESIDESKTVEESKHESAKKSQILVGWEQKDIGRV